jgi:hypothetical protein
MGASVSSERAFSQGGITISKRRNRLKGDIVEALQCIKCAIRHDLLFREPAPSSANEDMMNEDQLDETEVEQEGAGDESGDEQAWDDALLIEAEDDDDDDMLEDTFSTDYSD